MKYELAKQLKDAGFPFKNAKEYKGVYFEIEDAPEGARIFVYPTLSELIEACRDGESVIELIGRNTYWTARTRDYGSYESKEREVGSTPEEAVAKLWLALQKK